MQGLHWQLKLVLVTTLGGVVKMKFNFFLLVWQKPIGIFG
jgi:hypothetical protein